MMPIERSGTVQSSVSIRWMTTSAVMVSPISVVTRQRAVSGV